VIALRVVRQRMAEQEEMTGALEGQHEAEDQREVAIVKRKPWAMLVELGA
jgi:hypothetical protein